MFVTICIDSSEYVSMSSIIGVAMVVLLIRLIVSYLLFAFD